ncbi:MAG: hypothetical protein CUN56_16390, partial [Phototrophicales bacterium]
QLFEQDELADWLQEFGYTGDFNLLVSLYEWTANDSQVSKARNILIKLVTDNKKYAEQIVYA